MRSYGIVLTLSLISSIIAAQESSLMQNLNCSTDYESYTACTWFEHQEARSLVNMTLFHENDDLNLTNMACNSQKVGSLIQWECHRNQTIFNMWVKNVFIFKPELSLDVQLNVSFFDNVQPLPPQKLMVNVTEDGDSLLIWEAGDGTNRNHWLDEALDFEVTYKRFWESWEESSSLLVSNVSHCLLRHNDLVPGNTYVARVRSKPGRKSQLAGHYSDWSSAVAWVTPEAEVEAQPKNLHCRFNGINQLKCSWEVRQEITSSVLFALFYKDNATSLEKECSLVHEKELPSSPLNSPQHVLQSCEISVTSPNGQSEYLMTLRPKEEKRKVDATKQIKTAPPYNLSVTTLNNQAFRLQWKVKVPFDIQQIYQISYWKTGNPLEAKYVNASFGDKSFTFTSGFLEPGLSYTAKVRAKVNEKGRGGPWSEWSEEFQWTTNKIFPTWGTVLIYMISIVLIVVGLCCCYKRLLSEKRKWEATILSPPRTLLLADFFQEEICSILAMSPVYLQKNDMKPLKGHNGPTQKAKLSEHRQSSLEFQGTAYTEILNREILVTHPVSLSNESRKSEQHSVAPQTVEKIKLPTVSEAVQILSQSAVEKTVMSKHQAQIFDYDGPYLYYPPESSLPDVSKDVQAAHSEKMEMSLCLKYIDLPHCLCPQQLLVGKEKAGAPLFLPVRDEWEKEKQQPLKTQEGTQSDKSGKEESKGRRPQHLPGTNISGQNGPLDYIATEKLSIGKDEGTLLRVPLVASEKGVSTCTGMAAVVTETMADLSSTKMGQKKPEMVLSAQGQIPSVCPVTSQEAFDDYVMSLPATPGSMLKEGLHFSIDQPKHNKGFLIFSPDNKSPVLLSQVGDYCFFPDFKSSKESPKNPVGIVQHEVSETGSRITKSLDDSKPVGLLTHPYQDLRFELLNPVCQDSDKNATSSSADLHQSMKEMDSQVVEVG